MAEPNDRQQERMEASGQSEGGGGGEEVQRQERAVAEAVADADAGGSLAEPLLRGASGDVAAAEPEEDPSEASARGGRRPATRREAVATLYGVNQVSKMFARAANLALATYLALLALVYKVLTPQDELKHLEPQERQAASVAALVLAVAFLLVNSRFVFFAGRRNHAWRQRMGGIVYAALVTQLCSIATNVLLAYTRNAAMVDPVTRSRVFLLRWCEWIPLSGLMTFLSEGVGMPKSGGARDAILISLAQSVSCLGGLIFPFCPGPISWGFWMTVSMVTYLAMFWRVHAKRRLYLAERRKVGRSFIDKEHLDRVEFAYHLIVACCFFWTVLVIVYFINMALHLSLSPDHPWLQRDFSLAMLCDTVFDVLAKGIYMKLIVDVHFCVFDAEGRAQRQLGELRSLMSVLWDSSSDAIVISARSGDRVTSLLSPSFVRLAELPVPEQLVDRRGMALLLEVECQNRGVTSSPDNPQGASGFEIVSGSFVDCSEIPYGGLRGERMLAEADFNSNRSHEKALEVSDLICAAWNHSDLSNSEAVLMFQLCARRCEVKVSPHTDEMLVAVIRDVTERFKRLEAERKAHVEMVARQKEAQSQTRFVRHEVKNGLLAGIELCDSLRNALYEMERAVDSVKGALSRQGSSDQAGGSHDASVAHSENGTQGSDDGGDDEGHSRPRRLMEELDATLHEVLDTVLAEAMARDVIHEVYQPRSERLDILGLIQSFGSRLNKDDRFPVVAVGPPVPYLMLDPQLLRYIHRNAISNACKYGDQGATVQSEVSYDLKSEMLRIAVRNKPGPGHEKLMALGDKASDVVFAQGSRLHEDLNNHTNYVSSGDGAWIMQKCAKTMGGRCEIVFNADETVFTFSCLAEPLRVVELPETHDFEVPPDTWGIAVDDSKIQRKLLGRIMGHVGLHEENMVVLGATPSEIYNLELVLRDVLAKKKPCSKVLILVDENLDFCECECEPVILSGSLVMADILSRLTDEEESQVFALVRSANDSRDDVGLYTTRCHAFFPKAPMQKDRIRELLAPLWAERFLNHPEVSKT